MQATGDITGNELVMNLVTCSPRKVLQHVSCSHCLRGSLYTWTINWTFPGDLWGWSMERLIQENFMLFLPSFLNVSCLFDQRRMHVRLKTIRVILWILRALTMVYSCHFTLVTFLHWHTMSLQPWAFIIGCIIKSDHELQCSRRNKYTHPIKTATYLLLR